MKISKTIKLNRLSYYIKHLQIINNILPIKLTEKELEILAGFLSLTGDLSKDPFSTTGRSIVRKKLNIKTAGALGNHLDQLKKKGFIRSNNDILFINPIVVPNSKSQEYLFKLVLEEDDL